MAFITGFSLLMVACFLRAFEPVVRERLLFFDEVSDPELESDGELP